MTEGRPLSEAPLPVHRGRGFGVRAAALDDRRQLGYERGFAHVAQRPDAAGARGLFNVAPLLGPKAGTVTSTERFSAAV